MSASGSFYRGIMKTIINRSKATRSFKHDGIKYTLLIGANEVPDAVGDFFARDPYHKACMKKGLFAIRTTPTEAPEVIYEPDDYVVDLRLLKVVEALKAVAACDSVSQLERWLEQDGRKRVRDAILERGIALKEGDEAADEAEPVVVGGDDTE